MSSLPHITVATVVERDHRFLMVKENSDGEIVYNQPAGHVENGETIPDAAIRETLEETSWHVQPSEFLGVYQYTSPANGVCYVRHCFVAEAIRQEPDFKLDEDILEAVWLDLNEVRTLAHNAELRSPLVLQVIEDYLQGKFLTLDIFRTDKS